MLIGIVPGAGGICEGGPPALGKLPIHGEGGIAVVQLTSRENDINAKMNSLVHGTYLLTIERLLTVR